MDCNNCLPLDRLVTVEITTQTVFDEQQFGCIAILTNNATGAVGGGASVVDATTTTKEYTTASAAALDWDATSEVMKAVTAAFAQTPRASTVRVMWLDDAGNIPQQLSDLFACDGCQGIVAPDFRDNIAVQIAIADYVEPLNGASFYFADSSNVLTKVASDATSIAALVAAARYKYTSVYYKEDGQQFATSALSYGLGQDLNQDGSSFTMAFKQLNGLTPDYMSEAEATSVTAFLSGTGPDDTFGHYANIYTCVAGENMMLYGAMGDGGFFDTALLAEYMKATIQNDVAQLMATGNVDNTIEGLMQIGNVINFRLKQYQNAGWIVGDNREDGEQGYTIFIPQVASVAKRKNRITDNFRFEARLAGRVHATGITGQLTF